MSQPDTPADPAAAYLAEVRLDLDGPHPRPLTHIARQHVPRLAAAVEAGLATAAEMASTPFPDDEPMTAIQGSLAAAAIEARISCGLAFREAITTALTGGTGDR